MMDEKKCVDCGHAEHNHTRPEGPCFACVDDPSDAFKQSPCACPKFSSGKV